MKIVKKIFALSISAMMGVSFCAGTAFASTTPKGNYEIAVVRPTPVKARPSSGLRRSPGAYFMKNGKIRIYGSIYDAASLTYGDSEEIKGLDTYSYLHIS